VWNRFFWVTHRWFCQGFDGEADFPLYHVTPRLNLGSYECCICVSLAKYVGTFCTNRPTYLVHHRRKFVPLSVHIWYSIWVYLVQYLCIFGTVSVYVWYSICVCLLQSVHVCLTQYQCASDPAFVYVPLNKCTAARRPLCTEHWNIFPLCTVCGFCLHFSGVHTGKQYRQGACKVTSGHVRVTIFAVERQLVLHILCVFVALVIQLANRMRRIVICGLSDLPPSPLTLPH
jgi:hypothetical protein